MDLSSNRLTKAGEERRPEYRLPPLIIPAVIGPMGLIVIGQCIGHETAWIGPAFGYAMQAFGLTAVSNIAITYAVDNFKSVSKHAAECWRPLPILKIEDLLWGIRWPVRPW